MKGEHKTKVKRSAAAPKAVRLRSHRIEIAALDYGDPGSGAQPMLLVHGMRDLAWSLDSVAQFFRDRFRVVALDLRGHGDSDHVGYYALPHFILDVRAAVRGLGLERPVLVGHSFGGEVTAQYAGLFPEVLGALVLIEGLGPPPWEGEGSREAGTFWARTMVERLDGIDPEGRQLADLDEAAERILAGHPRIDPLRARFLAEQGVRPHPKGGLRWKWDPFLVTTWGSFNFGQMEQMWSRIRVPTLAVNGARSGEFWRRDLGRAKRGGEIEAYLAQDELQRRLACFPDVECVQVPGAGHMVHFDEPDALNEAIDAFLRRRLAV
jgi:pimeloyl-ACP methyl ester carboxylesterase